MPSIVMSLDFSYRLTKELCGCVTFYFILIVLAYM